MELLLKPAASEIRSILQRIKFENMEKGLSLSLASLERSRDQNTGNRQPWEQVAELQPISQFDTMPYLPNNNYHFRQKSSKDFFGPALTLNQFLHKCEEKLAGLPTPIERTWRSVENSDGFGVRDDDGRDQSFALRILQWNVLSQTLGTKNDNFSRCPDATLDWSTRCYRMLQEIARHDPDIITLQEVDQFPFLLRSLATLGYIGRFKPKPDSPCLHISGNSGPDGCAIFYKRDKFELQKLKSKTLEIWGVQSNQIVLSMMLKSKSSNESFVVASTHLKARKGDLMSQLRNEQGKDLLKHLRQFSEGKPIICAGDFNADPKEPVYATITKTDNVKLNSAYGKGGHEPSYTSWKIRGDEEHKETLDYIFCSSDQISVKAILDPVPEDKVGPDRFPNLAFSSDHLSLVADLKLTPTKAETKVT